MPPGESSCPGGLVLHNIAEICRVLQSIAGYYRVLQSIIECYRVFLAHLLGPIFGLVFLFFILSLCLFIFSFFRLSVFCPSVFCLPVSLSFCLFVFLPFLSFYHSFFLSSVFVSLFLSFFVYVHLNSFKIVQIVLKSCDMLQKDGANCLTISISLQYIIGSLYERDDSSN